MYCHRRCEKNTALSKAENLPLDGKMFSKTKLRHAVEVVSPSHFHWSATQGMSSVGGRGRAGGGACRAAP
ncbi:hypothetical protein EVAR_71240_1 [Eumeta japonica]|uniref:Uncharacterized protein n=1 Tax=Eumeta variegata TaxID=151549 RepID=A0A4C1SCS5_EUMVA|nr:hypothetical protein EVAR_71240_1 [Eumeta japonica]